mgnify:CR=1 FL=1
MLVTESLTFGCGVGPVKRNGGEWPRISRRGVWRVGKGGVGCRRHDEADVTMVATTIRRGNGGCVSIEELDEFIDVVVGGFALDGQKGFDGKFSEDFVDSESSASHGGARR